MITVKVRVSYDRPYKSFEFKVTFKDDHYHGWTINDLDNIVIKNYFNKGQIGMRSYTPC